jgi:hypothetical protein
VSPSIAPTALRLAEIVEGGYTLLRTLWIGATRLRGNRRITQAHNPNLFWIDLVALCVFITISVGVIYLGVSQ